MQLDKYKKRKQFFNIFNIIITLIIIALAALSIYSASQSKDRETEVLFGVVYCVFGVIALIMGVFLPPKEKKAYISGHAMKVLLFINAFFSEHISAPSLMCPRQLYRSWNYASMAVLSTFMVIFNVFSAFLAAFHEASVVLYIGLIVFWLILDVGAGFWTYYDAICTGIDEGGGISPIECGKKAIRRMAKAALILLVLFGSVIIVSYFITKAQYKPVVDIDKIKEEISKVEDKLDQLEQNDFLVHEEYDSVSEAVLGLKETYGDTKYYYILQYPDADGLNIISWTDATEQIYVCSFECKEDGSVVRTKAFPSNALTKADVAGKQDGVIE